ncbi:MAG: Uncharacterized protein CEN90_698 [Parcubacteria group bacterium Licking1014_17]|nr:MAG: Uncharacterized protein CEN90_698 [Parcubacteria group bacterium Licking1014_17]
MDIAHLLAGHSALILLPIIMIEGTLNVFLVGFLVALGYVSGPVAYAIVVAGNMIDDTYHYLLGRYLLAWLNQRGWTAKIISWLSQHRFSRWFIFWLGLSQPQVESKIKKIERHFRESPAKTLLFGKFAYSIGRIILTAAGFAKMPFRKYVWVNFWGIIARSSILFSAGYYFGDIYKIRDVKHLWIVLTAAFAMVLVSRFIVKRLTNRNHSPK